MSDALTSQAPSPILSVPSLPQDVMNLIAIKIHAECQTPGDPDFNQDLVSLSLATKSWRQALLPYLYAYCHIGGRGNFTIENWIARLLPRYGHFIRFVDVALCWDYAQRLPQDERELIELADNAATKRWETTRDGLISQLVAGFSNLSTITITALRCLSNEQGECLCLSYYTRTAHAFDSHKLKSTAFHGLATGFCPRLAEPIITSSLESLQTILFSDALDGSPSSDQPFELICCLPRLKRLCVAASSIRSHDLGSLNWRCQLEELTITNEAGNQPLQPIASGRLNSLLSHFESSLKSLVLRDITLGGPNEEHLIALPSLTHVAVHSTRDITLQTLVLLGAHRFRSLFICVAPVVRATPLIDALTIGSFAELKHVSVHLKESRKTPIRWDANATLALRAVCDERCVELVVTETQRQKEISAKIRSRGNRAKERPFGQFEGAGDPSGEL